MSKQSEAVKDLLYDRTSDPDNKVQPQPRPLVKKLEYDPHKGGQLETADLHPDRVDEYGGSDSSTFHEAVLKACGLDPTEVRIVGKVGMSKWQQRPGGEQLTSYRLQLEPRNPAVDKYLDTDEILALLDGVEHQPTPQAMGEPHAFVYHMSDMQLGKVDGGGLDHTITTFLTHLDAAKEHYQQAAKTHNIECIQLAFTGDCLEGNVSQHGRNTGHTSIELTITEQVKLLTKLMTLCIRTFAPLTDKLYVDVVNGNHDEAQRAPVTTNSGDGWATMAAQNIDHCMQAMHAPGWDHVTIRTPDPTRGFMEVQVGNSVCVLTHGHHFGGGANAQFKGKDWCMKQTHNQNIHSTGGVVQHGHFHSPAIYSDQNWTYICADTIEGGSDYFINTQGGRSRNAGLVYLLHNNTPTHITYL